MDCCTAHIGVVECNAWLAFFFPLSVFILCEMSHPRCNISHKINTAVRQKPRRYYFRCLNLCFRKMLFQPCTCPLLVSSGLVHFLFGATWPFRDSRRVPRHDVLSFTGHNRFVFLDQMVNSKAGLFWCFKTVLCEIVCIQLYLSKSLTSKCRLVPPLRTWPPSIRHIGASCFLSKSLVYDYTSFSWGIVNGT